MSATDVTTVLATLGLSSNATYGELKHRAASRQLIGILAERIEKLPDAAFAFVELPPDGWTPDAPRPEHQDDFADVWTAMDRATVAELQAALVFALWKLAPDLQRLTDIVRNLQAKAAKREGVA